MAGLPRLKISMPFGPAQEEICDLEMAKHYFNYENDALLVMVDGQLVHSYEELVQLANRDANKNKEFIEVSLLAMVGGG